jgi:2-oxoglutarate ferredoxin oxidoreductase subunit alpha
MAIEAFRIAIKYMTPVVYLSDGYLGNGSEPWEIPSIESLPRIEVKFRTEKAGFYPYLRDERTLARPWAIPGTPGLEHRIGGLEKQHVTGNVNYDPDNHDFMVRLRAEKVARIAQDIPLIEVSGEPEGKVLVLGWGSTHGAITTAAEQLRAKGVSVSSAHLRYLNPFPRNLGEVLSRFETVIVPELNLGQLALLVRARFLVDAISFSKVKGLPFKVSEIVKKINEYL